MPKREPQENAIPCGIRLARGSKPIHRRVIIGASVLLVLRLVARAVTPGDRDASHQGIRRDFQERSCPETADHRADEISPKKCG